MESVQEAAQLVRGQIVAYTYSGPLVQQVVKRTLVPIFVGLTGSEWA